MELKLVSSQEVSKPAVFSFDSVQTVTVTADQINQKIDFLSKELAKWQELQGQMNAIVSATPVSQVDVKP